MNVLIIPNLDKKNSADCTRRALHILQSCGCQVYMKPEHLMYFSNSNVSEFSMEECRGIIDMVVSVGGDGTLMHSAVTAIELDKPIIGINSGRLGFLTELEADDLDYLKFIAQGHFDIQERMLLHAAHHHQDKVDNYTAVNDVVVSRGGVSNVADIDIVLKNGFVTSYRADGVIFSTPTGSTAYSLSAGGPVVYAGMQATIVTPICPHSMFSRSMIYAADEELTVQGKYINNSAELYMTVDGQEGVKINLEDRLIISKDERSLKFITIGERNYYKKLYKYFLDRR